MEAFSPRHEPQLLVVVVFSWRPLGGGTVSHNRESGVGEDHRQPLPRVSSLCCSVELIRGTRWVVDTILISYAIARGQNSCFCSEGGLAGRGKGMGQIFNRGVLLGARLFGSWVWGHHRGWRGIYRWHRRYHIYIWHHLVWSPGACAIRLACAGSVTAQGCSRMLSSSTLSRDPPTPFSVSHSVSVSFSHLSSSSLSLPTHLLPQILKWLKQIRKKYQRMRLFQAVFEISLSQNK